MPDLKPNADATFTATIQYPEPAGSGTPAVNAPVETKQKPRRLGYPWRAVATLGICAMGGFCMWLTDGATGIGWAIVGILLVWG